jgi:predicted RNase H-like HicB family nuclease
VKFLRSRKKPALSEAEGTPAFSLSRYASEAFDPAKLTRVLSHESIAFTAKARYHYNITAPAGTGGWLFGASSGAPGCVTYGRTVDEARELVKDAISGDIASLRKHKDPIPTDDDTLIASARHLGTPKLLSAECSNLTFNCLIT